MTTQGNDCGLETVKKENLILQSQRQDFENRSKHSNLHIGSILMSVQDLQYTIIALFHELSPLIPIERLEFVWVHRALTHQKINGPPRI